MKILEDALTPSQKQEFVNYVLKKDLIKEKSIDKLSESLYEFRNSIFHSKEYQIQKATLPDSFQSNVKLNVWNHLANKIAIQAIKKLNCI